MVMHFLRNTRNYSYWMTKWLRTRGIGARLIIAQGSRERDQLRWDDPKLPASQAPSWVVSSSRRGYVNFCPSRRRAESTAISYNAT